MLLNGTASRGRGAGWADFLGGLEGMWGWAGFGRGLGGWGFVKSGILANFVVWKRNVCLNGRME